jgi:hypothetical protein
MWLNLLTMIATFSTASYGDHHFGYKTKIMVLMKEAS